MRKADDKKARISSAHFHVEIDEDEDEEDDEKIATASKEVHLNKDIDSITCRIEEKSVSDLPENNQELSIQLQNYSCKFVGKNKKSIDGNEKSTLLESCRVTEEISTLSVDTKIKLSEKDDMKSIIDDRTNGHDSIAEKCKPNAKDPVIIKLPMLDMNVDRVFQPKERTVSKFIFPSCAYTGATSETSKKWLEVPKRADDRCRIFNVSRPFDASLNIKEVKMNDPVAAGSVSSPDFRTHVEIPKLNGNADDSPGSEIEIIDRILEPSCKNTNSSRRKSITNVAIGSSIATSLIGASGGVPRSLLATDILGRSGTPSSVSISSTNASEETGLDDGCSRFPGREGRRKSRLPFLRLHMPQPHSWSNVTSATDTEEGDPTNPHHHHHPHHRQHLHHSLGTHFPHIHVPSFTFTGTGSDGTPRKFSFGIRRHSQMVSPLLQEREKY